MGGPVRTPQTAAPPPAPPAPRRGSTGRPRGLTERYPQPLTSRFLFLGKCSFSLANPRGRFVSPQSLAGAFHSCPLALKSVGGQVWRSEESLAIQCPSLLPPHPHRPQETGLEARGVAKPLSHSRRADTAHSQSRQASALSAPPGSRSLALPALPVRRLLP